MRRIVEAKYQVVGPHSDKEYTDWPALAAALTEWQVVS